MDIFVTQLRKAMFLRGMKQVEPNAEAMTKIAAALGVTTDYLLGKEEIPIAKLTLPQFHDVPVLGSVAAGTPIIAQEDIIGTVTTDKNVFALRCVTFSPQMCRHSPQICSVRRQNGNSEKPHG